MTVESALPRIDFRAAGYFDHHSGCRVVVATPADRPDLWRDYVAGAVASYRSFDAEIALDYEDMKSGSTTSIFFVAVDPYAGVVAGARVQGPLTCADDSHLVREWTGARANSTLRDLLADRIPEGLIEMKAGWVSPTAEHRRALSSVIARSAVHSMRLLGVRYAACSAATHALTRWTTTGGRLDRTLEPTYYPDERYLTSLMWWDGNAIADNASTDQLTALMGEADQLRYGTSRVVEAA